MITHTNTALLVIDVQQGIIDSMGFGIEYVARVGQAIESARNASIQVIYVRMAYRVGAPEVSANNRMLYNFAKSGLMTETAETSQIHSLIAPKPEDIVISRSRVSAFAGSALEQILRAQQIAHVVLCGNATRMGVLATFFDAADNDYSLTVLSDCCIDTDPTAHDFLMKAVYPFQANVVTLTEWTEQLAT